MRTEAMKVTQFDVSRVKRRGKVKNDSDSGLGGWLVARW